MGRLFINCKLHYMGHGILSFDSKRLSDPSPIKEYQWTLSVVAVVGQDHAWCWCMLEDRCISGERVESGVPPLTGNMLGQGGGGGRKVSISQYSLITNKTELSSS